MMTQTETRADERMNVSLYTACGSRSAGVPPITSL
jgi:hypothetical protein